MKLSRPMPPANGLRRGRGWNWASGRGIKRHGSFRLLNLLKPFSDDELLLRAESRNRPDVPVPSSDLGLRDTLLPAASTASAGNLRQNASGTGKTAWASQRQSVFSGQSRRVVQHRACSAHAIPVAKHRQRPSQSLWPCCPRGPPSGLCTSNPFCSAILPRSVCSYLQNATRADARALMTRPSLPRDFILFPRHSTKLFHRERGFAKCLRPSFSLSMPAFRQRASTRCLSVCTSSAVANRL